MLQAVKFDGEGAGVFHGDFSLSLGAERQTGTQLQDRWAEFELWILTLTLGCNEHLLSAVRYTDL